jgi:hypothetical protein
VDWKRGFFRLWVVGSLGWVAIEAYRLYFDCGFLSWSRVLCFDDLGPIEIDRRLAWILLPPLLPLVAGLAMFWSISGFKSKSN